MGPLRGIQEINHDGNLMKSEPSTSVVIQQPMISGQKLNVGK